VVRTVHAPAVAERGRQPRDANVPVIAGAVLLGVQRKLREWGVAAGFRENDEGDASPVPAEQREVVPVGAGCDAQRQGPTATSGERGRCWHRRGRSGCRDATVPEYGQPAHPGNPLSPHATIPRPSSSLLRLLGWLDEAGGRLLFRFRGRLRGGRQALVRGEV